MNRQSGLTNLIRRTRPQSEPAAETKSANMQERLAADADASIAAWAMNTRIRQKIDTYNRMRKALYLFVVMGLLTILASLFGRYDFVAIPEAYQNLLTILACAFCAAALFVGLVFVRPGSTLAQEVNPNRKLSKKEIQHLSERQRSRNRAYIEKELDHLAWTTKLPGKRGADARTLQRALRTVEARKRAESEQAQG